MSDRIKLLLGVIACWIIGVVVIVIASVLFYGLTRLTGSPEGALLACLGIGFGSLIATLLGAAILTFFFDRSIL